MLFSGRFAVVTPLPGNLAFPGRSESGLLVSAIRPIPQPAGSLQCAPEDELDLRVDAAQIVPGPALERRVDPGIDPNQEGLTVRHGDLPRRHV